MADQRTLLKVAGYVDGLSCRITDEESAATPWLVAELSNDFQTLRVGDCVRHINVATSIESSTESNSGFRAVALDHATSTWLVGVLIEASMSIPSSYIVTRKLKKSS